MPAARARAVAHPSGRMFSDADAQAFVDGYDDEIRYTDAQIGRVLDRLAADALLDRTVVVLTSDHGEALGERGRWDHCGSLLDVEAHVPMLWLVEGGPLEGARPDLPASTLDVLPTVLGLLALPAPPSIDGRDLARPRPDDAAIAVWDRSRVIRSGPWKLFERRGVPTALYRIDRDPEETHDLLGAEPEVAERLARELARRAAALDDAETEAADAHERLRAIGYVE